jgi:hypothetical protein
VGATEDGAATVGPEQARHDSCSAVRSPR